MTKDQFLNQYVLASRELDAFIADNIMGGCVDDSDDHYHNPNSLFSIDPRSGVLIGEAWSHPLDGAELWFHQWREFQPSTNLADAMLVVNRIRNGEFDGFHHYIELTTKSLKYGTGWGCLIYDGEYAEGETLPLAISRAAGVMGINS